MKVKRLIFVLLALCLLIALPIRAEAATVKSGTCGDNLTWVLDDQGTLTISGTGPMYSYDYGYHGVPWHDCNSNIEEVIIEDGITTISDYAFYDCENLTSVTIPDSVTSIGDSAFFRCSSLTGIQVDPNNPNYASDSSGVLFNKQKTKLIQAPGALSGSYTIPDSVTYIGGYAFRYTKLTNIVIPDSVIFIGDGAFSCAELTSITIPKGVTEIGVCTFEACESLISVTLPEGLFAIYDSAFAYCYKLTSITIPDSVDTIGDEVFCACENLRVVNLGNSTAELDIHVFASCDSLIGIYVSPSNTAYSNDSAGVLYSKDKTALVKAPPGLNGEYTILDSVTRIGIGAFSYCENLTGAIIPDGTTNIGNQAFLGCTSLRDIIIPGGVEVIEPYAFFACTGLNSVILTGGLRRIEERAFWRCNDLAQIIIPDSVEYIGNYAFLQCDEIIKVCYGGTRQEWKNITFGMDAEPYAPIHYNMNNDHLCDTCGIVVGVCNDQNIDHLCDRCGKVVTECADDDKDHACDVCGETMGEHKAAEGSHDCGYCGEKLSDCADTDIDHNCDTCGEKLSDCGDTKPADHKCDICKKVLSTCGDKNQDGKCDICGTSLLAPAPAKPYKIANVVSGVHVYWKEVPGAVKYGLWRSETGKNGTYKWIANPTVPHFTDTKVESGKTYYYKVTSMNAAGNHSEKSEAIGITYVGTPDITSRFNKAAGITVGWNKIQGATGYAIYRKSYSGNDAWVRVATIEGNSTLTWTDSSVKNNNGTAYKYTVRALAGSDMKTLSGCRNAGRSMVRLASRTISSAVKNGTNGIKVTWNPTAAASGYEVRFMVGNTVYKTFPIGNYKTCIKTFTGLKAGQTYKIQVRSYVKIDGMGFYSAWSTAKTVTLK